MNYSNRKFQNICTQLSSLIKRDISEKINKKGYLDTKKLDLYIDNEKDIFGDTVLVIGSHDMELKFAYTTHFTNTMFSTNADYQSKSLCGKILIGTPGCIGSGLDSSAVSTVYRIGLPTNIINFIQEMGQCGRQDNLSTTFNFFELTFHIEDYVYLIERAYKVDNSNVTTDVDRTTTNCILTLDEERQLITNNLNELCRMMLLNFGCWHFYIEQY